jgi:hypothetical protein
VRRGASLRFVMHAHLVLLTMCNTVSAVGLGGSMSPGKLWFLTIPVFAGLVGGIYVAAFYGAVVVSILVAFIAADHFGVAFGTIMQAREAGAFDTFQCIFVTGLLLGLVYAFTRAQREAERTLVAANADPADRGRVAGSRQHPGAFCAERTTPRRR